MNKNNSVYITVNLMKYYLSVLAIFKNEKHIMKEWLLHHMKEGVEHFYLIDNEKLAFKI